MSDRRNKITLNWRPAGEPARRYDDFAEVAFAPLAAPAAPPAPDRTAITARLENWGRWCRSSDGAMAAASMTGAICESMLRWAGGGEPRAVGTGPMIDPNDAALLGRAMVRITLDQRRLLGRLYVDEQRKAFVGASMRIHPQDFDRCLCEAQDALSSAISTCQNSNSK